MGGIADTRRPTAMPSPGLHALRLAPALAVALLAMPSFGTVLYKSIGPNGVVQFSDAPPDNARIVEQRVLLDASTPRAASTGPTDALALGAPPLADPTDEEIARANTQVDLAEHALALARGPSNSAREAMQLTGRTRTTTDAQRIAFYERNLYTARRTLLQALSQRWTQRLTRQVAQQLAQQ